MKVLNKIRVMSQVFFFVLVGLIAWNHYLSEIGQPMPIIGASSLHAICPYGGVETILSWLTLGVFVPKIHPSSMVLLVIILLLTILLGPVVCSYMCPLGSIQEWFSKIGRRVFGKQFNRYIPRRIDCILRYLRYGVLIFTVYLTTQSLKLVFLEVDPYYALFNFWSEEATLGGIIVLVLILVSSLFIERPWCKYACPFGAIVGLLNKISLFKIRRNPVTCIDCGKCSRNCPMNIDVANKTVVSDHQCISCGICTSETVCPIKNTVERKISKYKEASQ